MGNSSKVFDIKDLICISASPQSLQDQNCFSIYYKEYTDSKKIKFKISEFKIVCSRSYSKFSIIENLRLNIKQKFNFDHLKLKNEVAAEEYFKGMVNKPQQIYQAIRIIHYVYFYKNTIYFFAILKKKFSKEKTLLNVEIDKLLSDKHLDKNFNSKNNYSEDVMKFSKNQLEEFINAKNNMTNNNKGINDSNLFGYENNDIDSPQSRIKIYEKRESIDGFADILALNNINFDDDSDKNKENELGLKKFILKNNNDIDKNSNQHHDTNINHFKNTKLNNNGYSRDISSLVSYLFLHKI